VVKRGFSEKEIAFFMNIDFANHVALVALADEGGRNIIVGGGRYIVTEPGQAEIAFVVIDDYQGQGLGTLLMRHLAVIARKAGCGASSCGLSNARGLECPQLPHSPHWRA